MRENRPYGSEGGESGSTGLPYPYRLEAPRLKARRTGPHHVYEDPQPPPISPPFT